MQKNLNNKDYHLKDSKVFCMFPWLHLNVTPKGDIYPCCSNNYSQPFGNTKTISLKDAFNSPKMKELRLNMLNDVQSNICEFCYKHEEASPHSFRNYSKDNFAKYYDELIPSTHEDGTLDNFKMRYFDIRFSNICNFKCRTCGAEFSSQWALENRAYDKTLPILMHADDQKGYLLEEVLEHIDHIDLAYFAGGEPLITHEHYVMLEEMIKRKKTDIILRYNTNASNMIYKNYDILDMWKHFKKVELSCSIDHYGERAEWLRKGTDWAVVESNLIKLREYNYISFQINTVFSIFNYPTIGEFYSYLIDKNLIRKDDWHNSLYLAINPPHYSAKSLPISLKINAKNKAQEFLDNKCGEYIQLKRLLSDAVSFADESNTWKENKDIFFKHTRSQDKLRNENIFDFFPELKELEILED